MQDCESFSHDSVELHRQVHISLGMLVGQHGDELMVEDVKFRSCMTTPLLTCVAE